jgi:hypothetical protein
MPAEEPLGNQLICLLSGEVNLFANMPFQYWCSLVFGVSHSHHEATPLSKTLTAFVGASSDGDGGTFDEGTYMLAIWGS